MSDYDQRYVDLAGAEWERGATVLAPRLPLGAIDRNEVGQLIEAIEALGWRLEHYTSDGARMCPLFRRPPASGPAPAGEPDDARVDQLRPH